MSDASKRNEKQKWTIEKPKLDDARRLRGIYFTDLEDEEFKFIMKNVRRKLEVPMPAAMHCKTSLCRSSTDTCRTIGGHNTKYACIVGADESVRIRTEGLPRRNHEDHFARKGMNSSSHYNLVHRFIPMLEAMNIPDAKAAVEKWEKLEKIRAWELTKVKEGLWQNQSRRR